MHLIRSVAFLSLLAFVLPGWAAPASIEFHGQTYVNHGLVGVGRLPANLRDKFGETFGSFSAMAFRPGSWRRAPDGSSSGTLIGQPDRGYNIDGTTNYTPRFNEIAVHFTPVPAGSATQHQVELTLTDTVRYAETDGTPLTSLDPTPAGSGTRTGFPPLPVAHNHRVSLDAEGIATHPDGTHWVSDEYGPYLYKFSAKGILLAAIRPPEAFIPKRNGHDSFSSNSPGKGQPAPSPSEPETGRQNNQGLEGLSLSPDGHTLFALLQSATRQDGGDGNTSPRQHTRLLAYDVTTATPKLTGEYILTLPTHPAGSAPRVAGQSEICAISATRLLVLARDSAGHGGKKPASVYRQILLYDLAGATNLAGTPYDSPATPVAPHGVLATGIVPAARAEFIDLNDAAQLAKFGLHNGPADDANNLSEKWEALALVPALDPAAPNDWFLFVGNDNDFITQSGFQDGVAYKDASGVENDTMVLVYRLTLPGQK